MTIKRENVYCTLDTETVGGAISPTGTYNFGAVIHTKKEVLAKVSLLVMSEYDEIAKDDYAKKNFHLYEDRKNNGTITCVATEQDALNVIKNLCDFYNVDYVMAYNSGFDFTKTICRDLLNDYEFIDIYLMALQTITHLKSYRDFCLENELFSASKKTCSTSAESVYKFITKNLEFVEEHTALSDAEIEMEIFKRCESMHKKYTKNCHMHDCKENKCFPKR